MEKEMTFIEISRLYNAINTLSKEKFQAKPKFRYALAKNRDTLESFMKQIRETAEVKPEVDKDMDDYENARVAMFNHYSDGKRTMPEDKREQFEFDIKLLQEGPYKVGFDKLVAHGKEVDEFTKTSTTVQLYLVEMSYIPEDIGNQAALNDLMPILVDEKVDSVV